MRKKIKKFYTKNKKVLIPVITISVFILAGVLLLTVCKSFVSFNIIRDKSTEGDVWIPESSNYTDSEYDVYQLAIDPKEPLGSNHNPIFIENLSINFLEKPQLVEGDFDFLDLECFWMQKGIYKTGVVTSGNASGVNLAGYTSYFISGTMADARILHDERKNLTYVLDVDQLCLNHIESVPANIFLYVNYPQGVFNNPSFETNNPFITDRGHIFENLGHLKYLPENSLEAIDTIAGNNIYKGINDSKGYFYIKNRDGVYSKLLYNFPFGHSLDKYTWELKFKTDKGFDFLASYEYVFLCNLQLTYSDLSLSSLEQVGVLANGDSIYQEKDREGVREFYEYYKGSTRNEINSIKQDDEAPYTFEQFEKSYPVLYWQSPFGDLVEFSRHDFYYTYGCP